MSGMHEQGYDPGWTAAMTAEIEGELHRLRESQMRLLLLAEELEITIPRSCCAHAGETACASCSADWLAASVQHLERSFLGSPTTQRAGGSY